MKKISTPISKLLGSVSFYCLFLLVMAGINYTSAKPGILNLAVNAVDKTTISSWQDTVNTPPQIIQRPRNRTILPGESFYFTAGEFTDPDVGDQLTYTAKLANGLDLPTWLIFKPGNPSFRGIAPLQDTTLTVQITATDAKQASISAFF